MRPGNSGHRQFNQMQPVLIPLESKPRSPYGVSRPQRTKASPQEQSLALQRRQLLELVSLLVLGACTTVLLLLNLG